MTGELWVVKGYFDYDGYVIFGIFDTKEAAWECADQHEDHCDRVAVHTYHLNEECSQFD